MSSNNVSEIGEVVLTYLADRFGLTGAMWVNTTGQQDYSLVSRTDEIYDEWGVQWHSLPKTSDIREATTTDGGVITFNEEGLTGDHPPSKSSVSDYTPITRFPTEIWISFGSGVVLAGLPADYSFNQHERELFNLIQQILTASFDRLLREESYRANKDVYSRILRHDIRNRLSIIQGYAEALTSDDGQIDSEVAAESIIASAEQLSRTADNVGTIEDICENPAETTQLDLNRHLKGIKRKIEAEYQIEVSLEIQADSPVVTCHHQLTTALYELVENVALHTDAPIARVRVDEDGGIYIIQVVDTGGGIPEVDLRSLQRRKETQLEHSAGTGLWLVDRAVQYSGGKLTFDSGQDGTTATITLPQEVTPAGGSLFQVVTD